MRRGIRRGGLGQLTGQFEFQRFPFLQGERTGRAIANAGAQAVTITFLDEFGLAERGGY